MSSILKQQSHDISYRAFLATFQGYPDDMNIAQLFAQKFSSLYTPAIQLFITTCKGLPVGGKIIPGNPITSQIYNAGFQAFLATFQNYPDTANIAHLFANILQNLSNSIVTYISSCLTTPAAPPTNLSPGGLIIIKPAIPPISEFKSISYQAFLATFQNYPDTKNIAQLFSDTFKNLATETSNYIGRCKSPPGGGPLIAV